jgi:hypothetical protein
MDLRGDLAALSGRNIGPMRHSVRAVVNKESSAPSDWRDLGASASEPALCTSLPTLSGLVPPITVFNLALALAPAFSGVSVA